MNLNLCDMSYFMQKGDERGAQELTGIPVVMGPAPLWRQRGRR